MSFSEQVKLSVKKRAHFRCCLCHDLCVEIHHIDPQHEGGSDSETNAAPLCPSCHERYGANPEKRKFIREARDFWYDLCSTRYGVDNEQIKRAMSDALENLATKDDLERLILRSSSLVLGSSSNEGTLALEALRYSFVREEYIHPRILQELGGWISDRNSTVIGIDLASANRSNRFYGDVAISAREDGTWVYWTQGSESFGYRYIASSPSGIHMVQCADSGGGSGVFVTVMLLELSQDRCLNSEGAEGPLSKNRLVLKVLGKVPLGDRYSGLIVYKDGLLVIGPDKGWFERGEAASRRVLIL